MRRISVETYVNGKRYYYKAELKNLNIRSIERYCKDYKIPTVKFLGKTLIEEKFVELFKSKEFAYVRHKKRQELIDKVVRGGVNIWM